MNRTVLFLKSLKFQGANFGRKNKKKNEKENGDEIEILRTRNIVMWYNFRYFDRYILFFIEEISLILRLNFIAVVKN